MIGKLKARIRVHELKVSRDSRGELLLETVFALKHAEAGTDLGYTPFRNGWSPATVELLKALVASMEHDFAAVLFEETMTAPASVPQPVDLGGTWPDDDEKSEDGLTPG